MTRKNVDEPKILLLDIETAPIKAYTWGLYDQNISPIQIIDNAYMLSWSAKWYKSKDIMFDSIFNYKEEFKKDPKNDKKIAESIWLLLDEADIAIAYNGQNFDFKWLNTVFLKHKLFPVSNYKVVDPCQVAKTCFRFGSNKLEELAKYLGIGQKVAHEGFALWIKAMSGDEKAWKKMKEYNIHDVRLLEQVYTRMRPYMKNHPSLYLYTKGNDSICNGCGSREFNLNGFCYTRDNVYQRYRCKTCGKESRGNKSLISKEKRENTLRNVV